MQIIFCFEFYWLSNPNTPNMILLVSFAQKTVILLKKELK